MKMYGIFFSIRQNMGSGKNVNSSARKEALMVCLTIKVKIFFNQDARQACILIKKLGFSITENMGSGTRVSVVIPQKLLTGRFDQ